MHPTSWFTPPNLLRSHHYFAREFLFDRGDLEGNQFGDPLNLGCSFWSFRAGSKFQGTTAGLRSSPEAQSQAPPGARSTEKRSCLCHAAAADQQWPRTSKCYNKTIAEIDGEARGVQGWLSTNIENQGSAKTFAVYKGLCQELYL